MPFEDDLKFVEELTANGGEPRVADIGCGRDKFSGAVGVDIVEHQGITDIVHNLDNPPWPLDDNSFDFVLCNHLVEHVEDFRSTVREIHRILKPGGYLVARRPHYSHVDS